MIANLKFDFWAAFNTGPLWLHDTPFVVFLILAAPITVPALILTGKIARYCIGYPIGALVGGIAAATSWLAEKISSLFCCCFGNKETPNTHQEPTINTSLKNAVAHSSNYSPEFLDSPTPPIISAENATQIPTPSSHTTVNASLAVSREPAIDSSPEKARARPSYYSTEPLSSPTPPIISAENATHTPTPSSHTTVNTSLAISREITPPSQTPPSIQPSSDSIRQSPVSTELSSSTHYRIFPQRIPRNTGIPLPILLAMGLKHHSQYITQTKIAY